MPPGLNRALQVRTADRLRAGLARDDVSGLPAIDALSAADERELGEVGGGRLGAVAIVLESWIVAAAEDGQPMGIVQGLTVRAVVTLLDDHVRRTDLLGAARAGALLVVLSPGLDPAGGRTMAGRLRDLLDDRQVDMAGIQVELHVKVGAAYRSPASPPGWTVRALIAEAEVQADETERMQSVA